VALAVAVEIVGAVAVALAVAVEIVGAVAVAVAAAVEFAAVDSVLLDSVCPESDSEGILHATGMDFFWLVEWVVVAV
jgi:hypothetical protein